MVCRLLALCVNTKYFITPFLLAEIIKVLISHEDVKFVYTVKFNQDPVEALLDSKGQEDSAMIILLFSSL